MTLCSRCLQTNEGHSICTKARQQWAGAQVDFFARLNPPYSPYFIHLESILFDWWKEHITGVRGYRVGISLRLEVSQYVLHCVLSRRGRTCQSPRTAPRTASKAARLLHARDGLCFYHQRALSCYSQLTIFIKKSISGLSSARTNASFGAHLLRLCPPLCNQSWLPFVPWLPLNIHR